MADTFKSNPPGTQSGFGPGNPTLDRGGEKSYSDVGPHIDDVGDAGGTYAQAEVQAAVDGVNAVIAELRRRGMIHDES